MAKLNTKIVMLKGEQGKDGTTIKSVEKSASSGLVDTYTITLTNGSKFSFNVTNGKDGEKGKDGANGKDGVITNIDATLSTTSTNAIQNKAVAKGINSIQSQIDTLKEFPKVINTEWEFNEDAIGATAFPENLASTKATMPVGVYVVTYDIFVQANDNGVGNSFSIQLAHYFSDGKMFAHDTAVHKLPILPNSDLVPGTIASFTDIIELTQENNITILASLTTGGKAFPIVCGSYDMKTIKPTIVRLR